MPSARPSRKMPVLVPLGMAKSLVCLSALLTVPASTAPISASPPQTAPKTVSQTQKQVLVVTQIDADQDQPAFTPTGDSAEAILQRFKAVTGGAAWDSLRTVHTKFSVSTGGLTGSSEEWDDALSGRTAQFDTMAGAHDASGYDGKQAWHQSDTGPAHPDDGDAEQQDAVSDAYDTSNSYWYSDRLPGKVAALGQATDKRGARCDVVRVEPQGGTPYQMWFDHATGLLIKTVQQSALERSVSLYSDYKPAGSGLLMPFTLTQGDGDARYDTILHVQSVEVNAAPPDGVFDLPRQYKPDFAFDNNADSVTVPIRYVDDHIYLPLKINGHAELAMFDTGGAFIVSTKSARELGIKARGAFEIAGNGATSVSGGVAQADTVQIGGLTLKKPSFTTIPYFGGESDEPVAGAELLERFVIAIDYDNLTMTLTRPEAFHYTGAGVVVPFKFHDGHMPLVMGTIDGVPGTFTIDTGDNLAVTLNGPFTQANGLIDKYKPKFSAISGYGVGGADPAYVVRTHTLTLGGVTVHDRVTYLRGGKTGAGADRFVSGNIGNGVLRQFNLIFDYPDEKIIFEPSKRYGDADVYMRTGIIFDINTATPTISDIVPGSPAAGVGLAPGDTVISIDGISSDSAAFGKQFQEFNYKPAGSSVSMQVMTPSGQEMAVVMELRDLV